MISKIIGNKENKKLIYNRDKKKKNNLQLGWHAIKNYFFLVKQSVS